MADDATERRHGPDKGAARRGRGRIRQERSGRYSAAYVGPDGVLYRAAHTFEHKAYAEGWIGQELRLVDLGAWAPPAAREDVRQAAAEEHRRVTITFGEYAEAWFGRRRDAADVHALRPTTARDYRLLLDNHLLPDLGAVPLVKITPDVVESWHRRMAAKKTPRARAKAYMLLSTIMNAAVADRSAPVTENPCKIRGAGRAKPRREVDPVSPAELATIVDAMPARLRLAVQLAAWCALRYGEVFELRRADVRLDDPKAPTVGAVRIRRGVTWAKGETFTGAPKTSAGVRDVAIPPHLLADVVAHLAEHTEADRDALLFPAARGGNMRPSSFEVYWHKARRAADRDDLVFHGLRHSGAVLAAQAGATISELQQRLGHATPGMAMHYQHAAKGRDQLVAEAMSRMIRGTDG